MTELDLYYWMLPGRAGTSEDPYVGRIMEDEDAPRRVMLWLKKHAWRNPTVLQVAFKTETMTGARFWLTGLAGLSESGQLVAVFAQNPLGHLRKKTPYNKEWRPL